MEFGTGFLLIIDRTIALLKTRDLRRQTILKEIVEPVFAETEKVANNYEQIFDRLLAGIDSGDDDVVKAAAAKFLEDRIELKTVRTKLDALTRAYLNVPKNFDLLSIEEHKAKLPKERAELADFLISAFCVFVNNRNQSKTGYAAEWVKRYISESQLNKDSATLRTLRDCIYDLHQDSQAQWERTCEAYGQLKLKLALNS